MSELAIRTPNLHIRYDGGSQDIPMSDLDLGELSSDAQIKSAAADHMHIPVSKLQNFTVDRNADTGDVTLRPQAVFG
jgi:hypothetical protein